MLWSISWLFYVASKLNLAKKHFVAIAVPTKHNKHSSRMFFFRILEDCWFKEECVVSPLFYGQKFRYRNICHFVHMRIGDRRTLSNSIVRCNNNKTDDNEEERCFIVPCEWFQPALILIASKDLLAIWLFVYTYAHIRGLQIGDIEVCAKSL